MKNSLPTSNYGFFSQFSSEQIKKQYRCNYDCFVKMRDKAIKTGKKVNGYSLEKLESLVKQYAEYAK